uniref:Neurotransmitter-gated ion-channel ligand-binding domain-containing protein n=2 Tax=Timema TaxID=61471 RepID=A0A7R9B5A6_TIMSH|nr:unnamed protein product [Timema shepardi]
MQRWCFSLLVIIRVSQVIKALGGSCPADPHPVSSATVRLKNDKFCNYDTMMRPVTDASRTTTVKVFLWLKHLDFEWKDELLQWNPEDYEGVAELQLISSSIWVPDIALYSMVDMSSFTTFLLDARCIVDNRGMVRCVPPTVYQALCVADLTKWPFDSHHCVLRLGSWGHTGEHINLTFLGEGVSIKDKYTFKNPSYGRFLYSTSEYEPNREWELLNLNATWRVQRGTNHTFPTVVYDFYLKRHAGVPAAVVLVPAIVLATLTLLSFWIEAGSSSRISLCSMNVFAHCLYLQYVGFQIPSNGDSCPKIVLFFRDSMLLAGMSLVITVIAQSLATLTSVPPGWLSSIFDSLLGYRAGQIMLLTGLTPKQALVSKREDVGEDAATLTEEAPPPTTKWIFLVILLDRIMFLVFFLILLVLLTALIP